jgi:hypothetical protein
MVDGLRSLVTGLMLNGETKMRLRKKMSNAAMNEMED